MNAAGTSSDPEPGPTTDVLPVADDDPTDTRPPAPVGALPPEPDAPDTTGSDGPVPAVRGLAGMGESWKSVVLLSVLFLVLSVSLSVISQLRDDRYSLLDEVTHADYAYKMAHFQWPRTGSAISQPILQDWACRGQVNLGKALPACGATNDPAKYPIAGKNYNTFHPPLYYALTGWAARLIDAVIPGSHFVPIVRTLGAVWLAAAMLALFLTLRYWRVRREIALASGLLLLAIPMLAHAGRIATNDAPAALCGVAAVYVLGRVMLHQRTGWVLPAVLCALASATKTLNGLPLLTVGAVIGTIGLVRWRRAGWRDARPMVGVGLGIAGGAAVVYVGWAVLQKLMKLPGPAPYPRKIPTTPQYTGSPIDTWLSETFNGFGVTRSYYLHPATNSLTLQGFNDVLTLLVSASSVVLVLLYAKRTAARNLGWALMLGSVIYPLFAELKTFTDSHGNAVFVNLTTRYGISLISMAVAALALAVAARPAFRHFWSVLTGIGLVVMFASTLGWLTNV